MKPLRKIRLVLAGITLRFRALTLISRLPLWLINHIFAAQIIGWNELAKMQVDVRQKAICRAMKTATIEGAKTIGIKPENIPAFGGNPVTFELSMPGHGIPPLEFRESDWELIRAALAQHDAEFAKKGGE